MRSDYAAVPVIVRLSNHAITSARKHRMSVRLSLRNEGSGGAAEEARLRETLTVESELAAHLVDAEQVVHLGALSP